jgi:hypothetical protein
MDGCLEEYRECYEAFTERRADQAGREGQDNEQENRLPGDLQGVIQGDPLCHDEDGEDDKRERTDGGNALNEQRFLLVYKKSLPNRQTPGLCGLKHFLCLLQLYKFAFFLLEVFAHLVHFLFLLGDLLQDDLHGSSLDPRLAAAFRLGCIGFFIPGGSFLAIRNSIWLAFRTHATVLLYFVFNVLGVFAIPRLSA